MKTTSIAIADRLTLDETQLAEQIFNNAGLDPVVDAGLRDYDKYIQLENKYINKILGPRSSDIRGYGEAVAKRVAVAVYSQLSKQYGGKVGDLRSYIMTLEEERDRANLRYDELMGRAIGILGEEYKELKTDSNEFMEKLTNVMGEDLKASRINSEAITEKLADIDGLRSEIRTLTQEKEKLKEKYESQIAALNNGHKAEIRNLTGRFESQVAEVANQHRAEVKDLNLRIDALSKEKELLADTLAKEKEQLKERYQQQMASINNDHKVEIRNLNEKYESQIVEANNEHKAEIRKLNSRVEILTKEKELQKEQYESQIAELDSKIRSLESKKSDSTNIPKRSSNQVDTLKNS